MLFLPLNYSIYDMLGAVLIPITYVALVSHFLIFLTFGSLVELSGSLRLTMIFVLGKQRNSFKNV